MTMTQVADVQLFNGDFVSIAEAKPNERLAPSPKQIVETKKKEDEEIIPTLFACPIDGCVKLFRQFASLERHVLYRKCTLVAEKHNLLDMAKVLYREKLLQGSTSIPSLSSRTFAVSQSSASILPQGGALKAGKQTNRLSDKQKKFLNQKFNIGQQTGHKLDGATVSHDMRFAKNNNGEQLFVASEFLTDKQIPSYFSRLSSKIKKGQIVDLGIVADIVEVDDNEDEDDDEHALKFVRQVIINECQLEHPIVFDSFDLCKLSKNNNLTKLSVSLLRTMCVFFHLDCSHITVHRKAPYIKLLEDVAKMCSCNSI